MSIENVLDVGFAWDVMGTDCIESVTSNQPTASNSIELLERMLKENSHIAYTWGRAYDYSQHYSDNLCQNNYPSDVRPLLANPQSAARHALNKVTTAALMSSVHVRNTHFDLSCRDTWTTYINLQTHTAGVYVWMLQGDVKVRVLRCLCP